MKQLTQRTKFIGLGFVVLISSAYLVDYYERWTMEKPTRFVYQAKSASWEGVIEVRQAKNGLFSYYTSERYALQYIGKDVKQLYKNEQPILWEVDSLLSSINGSPNRVSHYSDMVGTFPGGSTTETTESYRVATTTDIFRVSVMWGGHKKETLFLNYTK